MAAYVVAVDLGGTLTKIAYAARDGSTTPPRRLSTVMTGGQASLDWLAAVLTEAVQQRSGGQDSGGQGSGGQGSGGQGSGGDCLGYAVVVPGILDVPRGLVRAATNLGWYDVGVRARLTALTGLPGVVGHDVRSGGLAEWRLGAGVGAENLLFLPLGTGIAGAMVVDGRLVDGDGYAGELGHTAVPAAGDRRCPCGQRGCLETVSSASALTRSYAQLASGAPPDAVSAEQVAERARTGDPAATAAVALAVRGLTEALHTYATLLAPETVVLGGGLAGAFDLLGPAVARGLDARMTFQRRPAVVPARLGADAGVIGAGLLGWDRLTREEPA